MTAIVCQKKTQTKHNLVMNLSVCFHDFSKSFFTQLPNAPLYVLFKNETYFLMDQEWETWMQISILNLKYKPKLSNTLTKT